VATLEKKVTVVIEENNVIIGVDWFEPQMTYDLLTTVQKNFQSARYDDDVAMISDAIAVLEEHAKAEAGEVDAALAEYQKLNVRPPGALAPALRFAPRGGAAPRIPRAGTAISPAVAAAIDPDIAAAREEKRQQIRSLETERQRELDVLRAQLAQAQLTLTAQHPTVIALQQKIDTLSAPDPQLAQLKLDERGLMARIAPPLATAPSGNAAPLPMYAPPPVTPPGGIATAPMPSALPEATSEEDPRVQLARSKLEGAVRRYQDAVTRIDGANMELEIARTAFKYRYTVVTPAEVPRKPKKATAQVVGVASVVGALLLALLLATGVDLWSGRILEEWQVRRRLKLEVLGEFDPSASLPTGPA